MSGRTSTPQPVRWRDLDPLAHVNTVVFLTYLEEGRNVWLADVLGPAFDPFQYVVARIELDLQAEIPAGTEYVHSEHAVEAVGRSSVTLSERLRRDDDVPAAEGRIVLVMWEPQERRSRPLLAAEREALEAEAVRA